MTIKVKKVPWLRLLMDKFGKTFSVEGEPFLSALRNYMFNDAEL